MGTRNLTMVIFNDEVKVAQYGQWDGHPDGQGQTVFNFLANTDLDIFKSKLDKVRFFNDEDSKTYEEFCTKCAIDGWMDSNQANTLHEEYPYISRDLGADILEMILKSDDEVCLLNDSTTFGYDTLLCEYSYIVDLDNNKLHIYGVDIGYLNSGDNWFENNKSKYELEDEDFGIQSLMSIFDINDMPSYEDYISILIPVEVE